MTTGGRRNAFHYDDNLHVLRERIARQSVDLIYLATCRSEFASVFACLG